MNKKNKLKFLLALGLLLTAGCSDTANASSVTAQQKESETGNSDSNRESDKSENLSDYNLIAKGEQSSFSISDIPDYSGSPYVEVNDNVPYFTDDDYTVESYEYYSDLDDLGRVGMAVANVGVDLMPTEKRESIGIVKPTGWHTARYDSIIPDKYLYNRCHLIGFQLTGENANDENLCTGTRYLNVTGMLPFENEVADYVKNTKNHVLYRVTPIFIGDDLVCQGLLMEARSGEDHGEGVQFNVFCYNVQPGIAINYTTVDSASDPENHNYDSKETATSESNMTMVWVTKNGTKYHSNSSCSDMKNPIEISQKDAVEKGYTPCKKCYG